MRRERLPKRIVRPSVKPQLEGLPERILPSATPAAPSLVAEMATQQTALFDQWSHLIATVEQEIRSERNAFAQEAFNVRQEVDRLLGILPNEPTQTVSVAGPSVGSGSGALTSGVQQKGIGSGSGSGSPTSAHTLASTSINQKTSIKTTALTAGSGSGSGPSVDTYIWSPHSGYESGSGSGISVNNLASNPQNWIKDGNTQDQYGTVPGNSPTDIAEFNGAYIPSGVSPDIIWDDAPVISTMEIVEYAGNQTVTSNLELTGVDVGNTALAMDGASGLNLNLLANTGKFQIDGDAEITNMNLTGAQTAQLIINSGTTSMARSGGYTENIGVQFTINKGATVNDQSYNALTFTASNLLLTVNGAMNVYWGTGTGITLIQQGQNAQGQKATGCYIDVSGGTLQYTGSQGVKDTIALPILVENSGNFIVTTTSTSSGGYLIVTGQVAQTLKYSVYMTGNDSSVNLSNQTTLECDDDYQQISGTLQTTDTTECTLQDGQNGGGTAIIAGGTVKIAANGGYGKLDVNCLNLNFNGALYAAIRGDTSGKSDVLNVNNGTLTLGNNSFLQITVFSAPLPGNSWIVIDKATNIVGDFPVGRKQSSPQYAFAYSPNTPKPGQYQVQMPQN